MNRPAPSYTAFAGQRQLAAGTLTDVTAAVGHAHRVGMPGPLLVFDDANGQVVDVDWREPPASGSVAPAAPSPLEPPPLRRGPGRPRLGVVPREVTLLPQQWDWLSAQPGGASVTLRKLVEQARRAGAAADRARQARDATYRFLHAIGGDYPGFEELSRALFADDQQRVGELLSAWPTDVRRYALALLDPTTGAPASLTAPASSSPSPGTRSPAAD